MVQGMCRFRTGLRFLLNVMRCPESIIEYEIVPWVIKGNSTTTGSVSCTSTIVLIQDKEFVDSYAMSEERGTRITAPFRLVAMQIEN